MAKKKKSPLVAICGRPNVGKSTLFNRLTGRQRSIIHKQEGITRDRAYAEVEWRDRIFRLVDTGGIVEKPLDPITHRMQEQVRTALDEAHVILFVVDGQQETTRVDEEIRESLFKLGKPVVLVVNKLDNAQLSTHRTDFYELGMGEPIAVSAGHGLGIEDLLEEIVQFLPPLPEPSIEEEEEDIDDPEEVEWDHQTEDADPVTDRDDPNGMDDDEDDYEAEAADSDDNTSKLDVIKVAVVGKPNVGKSSFINALLNEERLIVTDVPGTTRDAVDVEFSCKGQDYLLIDTAGLRKKAGISEDVERFSVSRSLRSIRRADVCLVMLDAVEGITEQDKRIMAYVREQGTAMVMVWTKWDLVKDKATRFKTIADEIDLKAPFLKYVPLLTLSNVTRQRLFTTFEYVDRVAAFAHKRIGTGTLNRFMESIRERVTPAQHKGQQAKILYATQVGVKPTTFILFVNQTRLFHFSYLRFIENQLRAKFGFDGVPITIELRAGEDKRGRSPKGKK